MMSRSITPILVLVVVLAVASSCDKTSPTSAPATTPTAGGTTAPAQAAVSEPTKAPAAAPASDDGKPAPGADSGGAARLKENPNAGKAGASDGQSLAEARAMVDTMARELKRSTAAVVMAGKDKDKVDAIGADFQKLNKTMSKQIETVSERLTPPELVQFEEYTRVVLSPLINQLLQAFFSSGGLQPGGAGPNGSTKLVPKEPASAAAAPTPAPPVVPATPTATPVASALGAGAAGTAPTTPTAAAPPAAARPAMAQTADAVPLVVAKGAVDTMARELNEIVVRIRAADNDKGKLAKINKDYTSINQKHAVSIPKLVAVLTEQQKANFSEYLKAKLMPVSSNLVQAFTEAGALPNQ
jgi:hypothetical protein